MRARWVLIVFAVVFLLVGIAVSPMSRFISPLDEIIWDVLTIVSVAVLSAIGYLAAPIARALDVREIYVDEAFLCLLGLAPALLAAIRLAGKDLSPRRRGAYTLLLMFSLCLPLVVVFTMDQWMDFGH